jgi:hypothetical protein
MFSHPDGSRINTVTVTWKDAALDSPGLQAADHHNKLPPTPSNTVKSCATSFARTDRRTSSRAIQGNSAGTNSQRANTQVRVVNGRHDGHWRQFSQHRAGDAVPDSPGLGERAPILGWLFQAER